MAWSYSITNLADSPKDQVRLRIGDTVQTDQSVLDEEIDYFLSLHQNNVPATCVDCIDVIINKFSTLPDFTLGPYSESQSSRLEQLHKIRSDLKVQVMGMHSPIAEAPMTAPIFNYDMMSVNCCIRTEGE
jgi:hypothetical protein